MSSLLTCTVPCMSFYFWKHFGRINRSIEGRKVIELKEPLKYLVTQWGWSKDFLRMQCSSQPELWRGGCFDETDWGRVTSLAVQHIGICLPTQGTWVWSLVWEDATCCGTTKPKQHSYRACALEPWSQNKRSPCSHSWRKLLSSNDDTVQPRINW